MQTRHCVSSIIVCSFRGHAAEKQALQVRMHRLFVALRPSWLGCSSQAASPAYENTTAKLCLHNTIAAVLSSLCPAGPPLVQHQSADKLLSLLAWPLKGPRHAGSTPDAHTPAAPTAAQHALPSCTLPAAQQTQTHCLTDRCRRKCLQPARA